MVELTAEDGHRDQRHGDDRDRRERGLLEAGSRRRGCRPRPASVSKPIGRSNSAIGSSLRASTPTSTAAVMMLARDSGRWIRPSTTRGGAPSDRADAVTSSGTCPSPDSTVSEGRADEADGVRVGEGDERAGGDGAGQTEADAVEQVVERDDGEDHAHRHHGAGHGVADRGQTVGRGHRPLGAEAAGVRDEHGDDEADDHRRRGSARGCCRGSRGTGRRLACPRFPVCSRIAQAASCAVGAPNPSTTTAARPTVAAIARQPRSRRGWDAGVLAARPSVAGTAAQDPLEPDGEQRRTRARASASSAAASRSYVPRQIRNTPTDNVSTPKYCTVAKSVSVSITTTAAPAAIAGRSSGSTTRRVASAGEAPSVRATK